MRRYMTAIPSDFSDNLTTMREELLREAAAGGFGGAPGRRVIRTDGPLLGPRPIAMDMNGDNLLMLFLRSILPWNFTPQTLPQFADDAGAGDDGEWEEFPDE